MLRGLVMLFFVGLVIVANIEATPPSRPAFTSPGNNDVPGLVNGTNEFAFELYRQLAQTPGNTFFSPYSIVTSLAQVFAGARGNTAHEIAQTLHFPAQDERLHAANGNVIYQLQGRGRPRPYDLRTANCLWLQNGLKLQPQFLHVTQTYYQGNLGTLDFYRNPEGSRAIINRWVEGRTNHKIRNLLEPGTVRSETRTVLTNAIYFKADWLEPFSEHATRPDKFTNPGTPAFQVPMMNLRLNPRYFANEEFQMAQLDYRGQELSMVLILPKKTDGLAHLECKLSARILKETLEQSQATDVELTMPKFKMTHQVRMKEALKSAGIRTAFSREADFSGLIANDRYPHRIDDVIHKAFVEVDEKGTEAAAATATALMATAPNLGPPPQPIQFRADHPFVFLIRHNATGSMIFLGRVIDPRGN